MAGVLCCGRGRGESIGIGIGIKIRIRIRIRIKMQPTEKILGDGLQTHICSVDLRLRECVGSRG